MELARCVAMQPKVLLLDETMCGLNPTEIAEMIALIRSIRNDGIALIVVEHIMDVIAELAEDVVVLGGGQVISRGPPSSRSQGPSRRRSLSWGSIRCCPLKGLPPGTAKLTFCTTSVSKLGPARSSLFLARMALGKARLLRVALACCGVSRTRCP